MIPKQILVIENLLEHLTPLDRELRACGFEVITARTAAEGRRLADLHWEQLDVAVLDMELGNTEDPTGASIAIDLKKQRRSFPPEFLIYSAMDETDYYRLALELGAAAYLLKERDTPFDVAEQVRILALRRALNGENPKIAAEIAQIAVHSRSKSLAIQTFCKRVLKPEFESCLGLDFVILLTEGDTTLNCADNANLPEGASVFYHTLQALAHGKGNLTEPFIFESSEMTYFPDPETVRLSEKINLAAFLPLSLSNDLKLSIGLLQPAQNEETNKHRNAKTVGILLAQYLRPTVLENVINIWSQWTELRATRTSTAKLCLSVGQEINEGLETDDSKQLEDLANDLNDTGQYLAQLDSRNWQDESEDISIGELVAETWGYASPDEATPEIKIDVNGDCLVHAQRSDLEIVFSRLLQWFVYRSRAMPLDVKQVIKIDCEVNETSATIKFEDSSHRLSKNLREKLFAPFTQAISTPFAELKNSLTKGAAADGTAAPKNHLNAGKYLPLYLAKMLVEGRYHGLLQDYSDEITEHPYGHRILMQIPTAKNTV